MCHSETVIVRHRSYVHHNPVIIYISMVHHNPVMYVFTLHAVLERVLRMHSGIHTHTYRGVQIGLVLAGVASKSTFPTVRKYV